MQSQIIYGEDITTALENRAALEPMKT